MDGGSTVSRLKSHYKVTVYFLPLSPHGVPETHLINLEKMERWVDLGVTHWFWTRDPCIENPAY